MSLHKMAFEESMTFFRSEIRLLPVTEGVLTVPAGAGIGIKDGGPVRNAENRGGILRGVEGLGRESRRGVADEGRGREGSRLGRDGKSNFLAPGEPNPSRGGMEARGRVGRRERHGRGGGDVAGIPRIDGGCETGTSRDKETGGRVIELQIAAISRQRRVEGRTSGHGSLLGGWKWSECFSQRPNINR